MFTGKAASDKAEADRAKLNIAECLRQVRAATGKTYFAQCREMIGLQRGYGQLSPQGYFYYRLYDDSRYGREEKRRFLSERVHHRIISRCCDPHWWGMADDKLIAYAILRSFGIRVPETYAVFDAGARNGSRAPTLRTPEALAAFLRKDARYPFFAKAIGGIASYGAWLVEEYDAAGDRLLLGDGESIGVESFVGEIVATGLDGYVFEELLKPHPALAEACGPRVSTVRAVVLVEQGGPSIIHTVWKVPVGRNIADNFWRNGNMLAAVDIASGQVTRCVQGVGPALREVENHPDTGKRLTDFLLPDWEALKRLCLEGAAIFSKLRYQSWDIALCPGGPVAVEVNTGSAFLLPQLATGRGILDDRFADFLRANGETVRL